MDQTDLGQELDERTATEEIDIQAVPWWRRQSKTTLILAGMFIVLFIVLVGLWAIQLQHKQPPCNTLNCQPITNAKSATNPLPKPILVPSHLNGVLVKPGEENMRPLAVMIENHPDARPQSGLGEADLVYEAIAEGGITRFMAVFANQTKAVRVGPVRSARTYFVDFATELQALYAHVGGSTFALNQIANTHVLDLDQSNVGAPTFQRDYSRPVALEHTMYSSTDKLWQYATETKKWSKTANFASWIFEDDAPKTSRPTAYSVGVSVSDQLYDVSWQYDPDSNSYLRSMAGAVHRDANTGKQITVKDVVLEQVGRKSLLESNGKQVWQYFLTGTGPATVLKNGQVIKATWQKSGTDRTRYFDANGQEIAFVRGPIWVELTHDDSRLTFPTDHQPE